MFARAAPDGALIIDLQPTLIGPKLLLRPIRQADFQALYEVAGDPELWVQHPAHDRWREERFRSYFETWLTRGTGLIVCDRKSRRVIGASCYSVDGRLPNEVEIGWTFLARDHWGGPTNRELKQLMIGHALRCFDCVVFRVASTNFRSRRALEKIGATLTDRTEKIDVGGVVLPHLIYAIDRSVPIGTLPG